MPLLGMSMLKIDAPLTVSANDAIGTGSDFTACGAVDTGLDTDTTVINGSGSYTYLWEQTGPISQRGPYIISNAAAQNPSWSDTVCDGDSPGSENWKVTVTDTVTEKTAETTILVRLTWANLS